jgi:hypothetical protein
MPFARPGDRCLALRPGLATLPAPHQELNEVEHLLADILRKGGELDVVVRRCHDTKISQVRACSHVPAVLSTDFEHSLR